jgi:hypothetical protein
MTRTPAIANNVTQAVPFLRVSSMRDSLRFYVDGLGCTISIKWVVDDEIRWCWLDVGGAALMLQESSQEGHDSWTPSGQVGVGVSLFFICQDAIAIYHDALAHGLNPERPVVGNGMWVTTLSDPDGYRIEFESKTDVAEGTVYEC